jgi:hypothetical protein
MRIQEESSKLAHVIQSGEMSARVSPSHSRNFETIHEEDTGAKTLRKSNPYAQRMFTEKTFFGAMNEYHKFDKMQHA